jgi:hypothetical protein
MNGWPVNESAGDGLFQGVGLADRESEDSNTWPGLPLSEIWKRKTDLIPLKYRANILNDLI